MKTKTYRTKKLFFMYISTTLSCLFLNLIIATPIRAYEISTPVDPTGKTWEPTNSRWRTTFNPLGGSTYNSETRNGQAIFIRRYPTTNLQAGYYILNSWTGSTIPFTYGNYYSVNLSFNVQNFVGIDMQSMPALNRINIPEGKPYRLMTITSDYVPCAGYITSSPTSSLEGYTGMCNWGSVTYNIIVQATDTATADFQLGLDNTDMFRWWLSQEIVNQTNYNIGTIYASTIMEFKKVEYGEKVAQQVNNQQQQAGEQAQQEGDTAGNQAGEQAQQETATMFQTIGNILGAITDTPPGDCTISGNMGNVNLGTLNFCVAEIEPIRPIIRTVIYLVMALATYKILMWVIGAIAGLINWVQTGNEGKEENG